LLLLLLPMLVVLSVVGVIHVGLLHMPVLVSGRLLHIMLVGKGLYLLMLLVVVLLYMVMLLLMLMLLLVLVGL
jgi:hypothetical protein